MGDSPEAVRLLLDAGADPNIGRILGGYSEEVVRMLQAARSTE